MIRPRLFPLTVLALSSCISQASPAHRTDASPRTTSVSGAGVLVNRDHHGLALEGFDPVAYFTDGQPVLGSADITAVHVGASRPLRCARRAASRTRGPWRTATHAKSTSE